jgi:hypothetical protein
MFPMQKTNIWYKACLFVIKLLLTKITLTNNVSAKLSEVITFFHNKMDHGHCKVQLSPCLNKHKATMTHRELRAWLHTIYNFDSIQRWISASHSGHFTFKERYPSTHFIRQWVAPRTCLATVVKKYNPCQCKELNPVWHHSLDWLNNPGFPV